MARQPQYKRQRRYDETDSGNKPVKDELADLSDDFACAVPAADAALYFATLAVTGGVGWSIHLWAGAAVLAGAPGLLTQRVWCGKSIRRAAAPTEPYGRRVNERRSAAQPRTPSISPGMDFPHHTRVFAPFTPAWLACRRPQGASRGR